MHLEAATALGAADEMSVDLCDRLGGKLAVRLGAEELAEHLVAGLARGLLG